MLITLASIKGSPGVTTFALALAARWPSAARSVLVEYDPVGGDIAARFGLTLSPGLISLAAAGRRASDLDVLWQHTQTLSGGLPVVAGPLRPDKAATALRTLVAADGTGGVLAAAAGRANVVVIADCGRLDPDSPTLPVIAAADQLLLLVRPMRDFGRFLSGCNPPVTDVAMLHRTPNLRRRVNRRQRPPAQMVTLVPQGALSPDACPDAIRLREAQPGLLSTSGRQLFQRFLY